jgi:hypothetical protein
MPHDIGDRPLRCAYFLLENVFTVLTFPNLFGRAHPPEKLAGQPHFC